MRTILLVCGVILSSSMALSAQSSFQIIPGKAVGSLALGDTHAKALELYPFKKDVDQEFAQEPDCGSELNFVDLSSPKQVGNVFIQFRNDRVFQIDVASNRYKTKSGISISSSPQEIRKAYPHLRSYILSNMTSEALNNKRSSTGLVRTTESHLRSLEHEEFTNVFRTKSLSSNPERSSALLIRHLIHLKGESFRHFPCSPIELEP